MNQAEAGETALIAGSSGGGDVASNSAPVPEASVPHAIRPAATARRSFTQRVVFNSAWSVASDATGKAIFFLAHIHLARALGVEQFGLFVLAQTIAIYFWFAVDLGIGMYGIREIARDKSAAGEIINTLLTLRIAAGLAVFAVFTVTLLFLHQSSQSKLAFFGCGFYLLTYAIYADWIFKGLERFDAIALGSLGAGISFLLSSLVFVTSSRNVVAAALCWSLSYLVGSLLLLWFAYGKLGLRYRPMLRPGVWLLHLRKSIYFTTSGFFLMAYQYAPILLLSLSFTEKEVGIFSAGYKIVITINGAGFLVAVAFFPVLSDLYANHRTAFLRAYRHFQATMLLCGIPLAVVGTLLARPVIALLFGAAYRQSAASFAVLVWLVPLYFLHYTYGTALLATGRQKQHNVATLAGLIGCLVFSIPLMAWRGPLGSAWALLAAEALMIGVMALMLRPAMEGTHERVAG
jgi:O-antigen/teichoic acid export membrane protein